MQSPRSSAYASSGQAKPFNGWRAVFALAAWVLLAAPSATQAMPKAGEPAPDFVGYDYDGQRLSLANYSGKVVVLSFWASWCGPCRKELPLLEGIARTAGKERIQVLAVNIESLDVYRKLARRMSELQMLVAHDIATEAQRSYGVNGIPHMVIIGKDGRVIRVNRGYSDAGVDQAIEDLNQALAQ
jgi:thiol-disulfide isomerase/thioredoxin